LRMMLAKWKSRQPLKGRVTLARKKSNQARKKKDPSLHISSSPISCFTGQLICCNDWQYVLFSFNIAHITRMLISEE
jgi:hypothetical protein